MKPLIEDFEPYLQVVEDHAATAFLREQAIERLQRANAEMKAASTAFQRAESEHVRAGDRMVREANRAFDLHPWTETDQAAWIGS